jgi:hypothetical protein
MRIVIALFLFFPSVIFTVHTDFDVTIVGTSPIAMLEAIYHIHKNQKVLILEAEERYGGAWKSIDICGVAHADLGCHLIGSDYQIRDFFRDYFGCRFVCLDHPNQEAAEDHAKCPNGFYFSRGCYELTSKLKSAIDARGNATIIQKKLDSIYIDSSRELVELIVGNSKYSTSKLVITSASDFVVQNLDFSNQQHTKNSFYHLYMLVEDPMPTSFTYLGALISGISRAMNLTPFVEMENKEMQFIVIQTHGEDHDAEKFLAAFKSMGFLSANARVVTLDTFVYQQAHSNTSSVLNFGGQLIEVLDTSNFAGMVGYLEKWKGAMGSLKESVSIQ